MFDLAFSEILLVAVVALIVLGPEKLPQVARTAGHWLGRLQGFVAGVKSEFAQEGGLGELGRTKDEFTQVAQQLRQELAQLEDAVGDAATLTDLPPWERLPPQRSPADFGIAADGSPVWAPVRRQQLSLRRQAMQRKRDLRPRFRPRPQLRVRRHSSVD